MDIKMARGDTVSRAFTVKNKDGTVFAETPDEIYFTVKKTYTDRNFKFQKRLSTGGIESVDTGKYKFTIFPEDTNGLTFGDYDFDIEIVKAPGLKQTFCGKLTLQKEVTHSYNEG